jgi:hypothetical protein
MKNGRYQLYKKMWWCKVDDAVEVLHTGHFPTTAIVRLSDGREVEVDITELEQLQE